MIGKALPSPLCAAHGQSFSFAGQLSYTELLERSPLLHSAPVCSQRGLSPVTTIAEAI